ncbi:MAG: UDP-N-acetylglucosamine 1-carboxyvinyltransferase [Candidatus Gracilibacteria bacterium]|nr:UDP-N-acetylglucosamine 1-carboxyvinyltransferase [Candidatus Gracilibacteria bacterium]MDD4530278.1 UDP-N-acetylglucosamine 1-carboxyvinyltransferase [Candidatus Gracilibacteria bacterium]
MLKVAGGQTLSGEITISGSKNASLPIIAASLLFKKVTLKNIPHIGDVQTFLTLIESLGVKYSFDGNILKMDNSHIIAKNLDIGLIKKIRVGIFLLGALLPRFKELNIPYPGGCNIGKRSIDDHIKGFEALGFKNLSRGDNVYLKGKLKDGDVVLNAQFSVTATENLLIGSIIRNGKTTIKLAAIEPHVLNLIDFLNKGGAKITLLYDHTIIINGVKSLKEEIKFEVISDYIESGTFIVFGALAAKKYIDIKNARIADLTVFLEKAEEAGVKFEDLGNDILRVHKCNNLKAVDIQTNVYPGFPTDLQSPFSVLLSQANGISKIHEVLFEGRLNYLIELEKMKGHPAILNPHEALIFGKTQLKGTTVSSWDLRAGVAMIIAGTIAKGITHITNVEYIERGYENIIGKLDKLGVKVETIDN